MGPATHYCANIRRIPLYALAAKPCKLSESLTWVLETTTGTVDLIYEHKSLLRWITQLV